MEFDSIENLYCDIYDKILKTGDVSLLGGNNYVENWDKICDEFIQEFGISKEFQAIFKKYKQYILFLDKAINGGDPSMINFAERAREEAEELEAKAQTPKSSKDKYFLASKYMGYPVRAKETTVKEFYHILKAMQNEQN